MNRLFTIAAIGFIILAIGTSTAALTGFAIADTPAQTGILGVILFVAGIASYTIGILKAKGFE